MQFAMVLPSSASSDEGRVPATVPDATGAPPAGADAVARSNASSCMIWGMMDVIPAHDMHADGSPTLTTCDQ